MKVKFLSYIIDGVFSLLGIKPEAITYESYSLSHLQTNLTHQRFFFWHDLRGKTFNFLCVVSNHYWLLKKDRDEDSPAKQLILFRIVLLKSHIMQ